MVIIGLGSNIGERGRMLDAAVEQLAHVLDDICVSKRYETPALLLPGSPPEWNIPFVNMAVSGTTRLKPHDLLAELRHIEQKLGRIDRGRWAPREIDLDILAYDDIELSDAALTIPHKELLNRYFALAPLTDVAPNWLFKGKTAREHLRELFP
jgi:2-amino-4-hydroxy-6-hydroxymethyldihydropteridine diphosphokinase/dihydropteroate synthase